MRDFCTGWPDSIDGIGYGDCCEEHDKAYLAGGVLRKIKADWKLMRCVWKKGKAKKNNYVKWNAVKMYLGVSILGWPFWLRARR